MVSRESSAMPSRFPKIIRDAMEEQGLSLRACANLASITPSQLSRFLNRKADIRSAALERLCIALRLSLQPIPNQPRKTTAASRTDAAPKTTQADPPHGKTGPR